MCYNNVSLSLQESHGYFLESLLDLYYFCFVVFPFLSASAQQLVPVGQTERNDGVLLNSSASSHIHKFRYLDNSICSPSLSLMVCILQTCHY